MTTDFKARHDAYCNVARQINTGLPRIFLYERLLPSGYRTHIQDFVVSPGADDFSMLTRSRKENWWQATQLAREMR